MNTKMNPFSNEKSDPVFPFVGAISVFALIIFYQVFRYHNGFDPGHGAPNVLRMDFEPVMNWAKGYYHGGTQGYIDASNAGVANVYPPFFTLLMIPFSLLPIQGAYVTYMSLLLMGIFVTFYLALKESAVDKVKIIDDKKTESKNLILIAALGTALLNQTYPVIFSFSRGNSDLLAMSASMAALYFSRKGKLWSAVLALTLACQVKVYPLILLPFLFYRMGWACIPLFGAINLVALNILGHPLYVFFRRGLQNFAGSPYVWVGNHSTLSFFHWLKDKGVLSKDAISRVPQVNKVFLYTFCASCGVELFKNRHKLKVWISREQTSGFSGVEAALIGMAFQLMALLPSVSHDYKLVIQIAPFLIVVGMYYSDFSKNILFLKVLFSILAVNVAFLFAPADDFSKTPSIMISFVSYFALYVIATREVGKVDRSVTSA